MGRPLIDLAGMRFGRLVVLRKVPPRYGGTQAWWECLCDCKKVVCTASQALRFNKQVSCGCYKDEAIAKRSLTHGHTTNRSFSPTFETWRAMVERCGNPRNKRFRHYGGRGIQVCERWLTFEAFLADMGDRPQGTTIERIDNNKGYCRENCRWAFPSEQHWNKQSTIRVTYLDKVYTLLDIEKLHGVPRRTLGARVKNGWSPRDIVELPLGAKRRDPLSRQ